jgi:hypothetical protein
VDEYVLGFSDPESPSPLSIEAVVARAFVLYDRTVRFHTLYSTCEFGTLTTLQWFTLVYCDLAQSDVQDKRAFNDDFKKEFVTLEYLLFTLRHSSPAVDWTDLSSDVIKPAFLACSLLDGASIHLHGVLWCSSAESRRASVCAANDMFGLGVVAIKSLCAMHPIMGVSVLWLS